MSPGLGEEVSKDPGCPRVPVAQGGQGLACSKLPGSQSGGADVTELPNVGCVRPGKITKARLNTACNSLYHLGLLFTFKNNNFLKK